MPSGLSAFDAFRPFINLQSSMDLIKSVQLFLAKIISYEGVNNVSTNAKELAEKIGIVPEFEKETIVCQRKIKMTTIFLCGSISSLSWYV